MRIATMMKSGLRVINDIVEMIMSSVRLSVGLQRLVFWVDKFMAWNSQALIELKVRSACAYFLLKIFSYSNVFCKVI